MNQCETSACAVPTGAREAAHADDHGDASRYASSAQFRELDAMGAAFGADFSAVRLHQGDGVAEAHGAHALTRGDEVHFAAGRGPDERALLGHELATSGRSR